MYNYGLEFRNTANIFEIYTRLRIVHKYKSTYVSTYLGTLGTY